VDWLGVEQIPIARYYFLFKKVKFRFSGFRIPYLGIIKIFAIVNPTALLHYNFT
jgi:hypothetical protein